MLVRDAMRPPAAAFLALTTVTATSLLAASPGSAQDSPAPAPAAIAIAEGDSHWARRAEGATGGSAKIEPIDLALAAYRRAAAADPSSLEARWKLMRAVYFRGEYATVDVEAKRRVFDEGRRVGDEALALLRRDVSTASGRSFLNASPVELAPLLSGRKGAVETFLWASVDWGKWSLAFGKMAAVKQGAAAKIRDYATAAILLDPSFDGGGGYRVLGRLHHQTPSVPFLTGWASRGKALEALRKAVKLAPRNFVNRLYLAEAIWDYETDRRGEARGILEAMVAERPSEEDAVEERRAQEEARSLLAAWGR